MVQSTAPIVAAARCGARAGNRVPNATTMRRARCRRSRCSATIARIRLALTRPSPTCRPICCRIRPGGWRPTCLPCKPTNWAGAASGGWRMPSACQARPPIAGYASLGASCCPWRHSSGPCAAAGWWAWTKSGSKCPRTTNRTASTGSGCMCMWRSMFTPMTCSTSPSSRTPAATPRGHFCWRSRPKCTIPRSS